MKATWDDERSVWRLVLQSTDSSKEWEEECNVLLNGTGFLKLEKGLFTSNSKAADVNNSNWKWPTIPGLETFKGPLFHTASYQDGYDLKGKRVAVIGSGSSGVQVVASIYSDVAQLYTWVRSPTWITAGFAQEYAGEGGRNFDCKLRDQPQTKGYYTEAHYMPRL